MTYLINTDWVIDYLKGRPEAGRLIDPLVEKGISISLITYGEILEGIYYGRERDRHAQAFRDFLQATPIVPLTESCMEYFADIRGGLRASGQIIGDADILIAATTLVYDLIFLTQNTRHFARVPG
jgi:tRNA(fMet)-specific endonuclease VapC